MILFHYPWTVENYPASEGLNPDEVKYLGALAPYETV